MESRFQLAFGDSKTAALTEECRRCRWLPCCYGGCLKDRFGTSANGEAGQYYVCEGLKMFFAHAEKPMKRLIKQVRRVKP